MKYSVILHPLTQIELDKCRKNDTLPAWASMRLRIVRHNIQEALKPYEESRIELCKKYGVLDEVENKYKFSDMTLFHEEISKLLDEETDLKFSPISVKALPEKTFITEETLEVLDW